jgi:hypothetical protein
MTTATGPSVTGDPADGGDGRPAVGEGDTDERGPAWERRVAGLRTFNLALAALHAVQATVMVVLANDLSLPVTGAFSTGQPGRPQEPVELERLFSYQLGAAVALFLYLSALFHLIIGTPWGFRLYRRELARRQNRFRWVEYSLSASLMIVIIAGLVGITDVAALMALFALNAAMILFGWLMETHNRPGPGADWSPFVFGCLAGVVPWAAIVVYLVGAGDDVPGFVYGIFVSLFVFFNGFALNQWLQYRRTGRWADYLVGERVYVILSLTAKSALAWQVFANVLMD